MTTMTTATMTSTTPRRVRETDRPPEGVGWEAVPGPFSLCQMVWFSPPDPLHERFRFE